MVFLRFPVLPALFFVFAAASAAAGDLASHKNALFAYPAILEQRDGGAYRVVDYREMRDINGRDAVPEKRVRRDYVNLSVRDVQTDRILKSAVGRIRHYAVGLDTKARFITIYLHGQGGSRRQGVDDFTFGGNFNRIKNLMADNGGLYLSPDFADFGERGTAEIAALIDHYADESPRAPVFLACGSAGGALCWSLARDPAVAGRLGGLLLLGSHWSDDFVSSPAFRDRAPVFIGHGSRDTAIPVERQEAFYETIRARAPGYPVRFVRFETGTHGTPIRMSDWRETINWMLEARQ